MLLIHPANYYIPDNANQYQGQQTSQKSNNFDVIISVGYFYTLVLKSKLYISGGFTPGFGYNFTKLLTRYPSQNLYTTYSNPVLRSQERIGLGYNSRKLFAGGEVSITQTIQNQNNTSVQVQATRIYFQVFIGYRFAAPRFIKHETDEVKKLAPSGIRNILE